MKHVGDHGGQTGKGSYVEIQPARGDNDKVWVQLRDRLRGNCKGLARASRGVAARWVEWVRPAESDKNRRYLVDRGWAGYLTLDLGLQEPACRGGRRAAAASSVTPLVPEVQGCVC
jgi:hypothetical protein